MRYIPRLLSAQLKKAARNFPAVLLTGPRQCGKTTLLRNLFPDMNYVLLEDPDILARIHGDARAFLDELELPVILDEIQNVPELLNYIRSRIDAEPRRKGRWLLTGSQEAPLMQGVSESMAGRVAVLQLLPLSVKETDKTTIWYGGFPDVLARPAAVDLWFRSYVQTYLERDVRSITAIKDLATFRRFLALLASRCGYILNKTDLAAPLGVSVPTITSWLNVLEITGQIMLVPPFFENFGKRLIKSPKVYFTDSGLACHLLGIDGPQAMHKSPFQGMLYEGFVAAEIFKHQVNLGKRRELYYFRDQQGLEVDFIMPKGPAALALIEVKSSKTPRPEMASSLQRLAAAVKRYRTESFLVHGGSDKNTRGHFLLPGISAMTIAAFLHTL